MQILIDDASAMTLLNGQGMRVLLFHGPADSPSHVTAFARIRWPAGVAVAVLPTVAAPAVTRLLGVSETPAVGAVLDGELIALETGPDLRAAAVRAVAAVRSRAGPRRSRRRRAG